MSRDTRLVRKELAFQSWSIIIQGIRAATPQSLAGQRGACRQPYPLPTSRPSARNQYTDGYKHDRTKLAPGCRTATPNTRFKAPSPFCNKNLSGLFRLFLGARHGRSWFLYCQITCPTKLRVRPCFLSSQQIINIVPLRAPFTECLVRTCFRALQKNLTIIVVHVFVACFCERGARGSMILSQLLYCSKSV